MIEHNFIFLSKNNAILLALFCLLAIVAIVVLFKFNIIYYNELETLKRTCTIEL